MTARLMMVSKSHLYRISEPRQKGGLPRRLALSPLGPASTNKAVVRRFCATCWCDVRGVQIPSPPCCSSSARQRMKAHILRPYQEGLAAVLGTSGLTVPERIRPEEQVGGMECSASISAFHCVVGVGTSTGRSTASSAAVVHARLSSRRRGQ